MEDHEQELRYISYDELKETYDDEWERHCEQRNRFFLETFWDDMKKKNLSDKTADRHYANANVFLSTLQMREGFCMEDALMYVDFFMGNWFIRRCMWSKPSNMKSTALSIKKFAKSMLDHGYIDSLTYEILVEEIKEKTPEWEQKCRRYNYEGMDEDDLREMFRVYGPLYKLHTAGDAKSKRC